MRLDFALTDHDGAADEQSRHERVMEEAAEGAIVLALEDADKQVRRAAMRTLAAFAEQGVEAGARGQASEGAAGNAARQLVLLARRVDLALQLRQPRHHLRLDAVGRGRQPWKERGGAAVHRTGRRDRPERDRGHRPEERGGGRRH